jgi:hypothetical protein
LEPKPELEQVADKVPWMQQLAVHLMAWLVSTTEAALPLLAAEPQPPALLHIPLNSDDGALGATVTISNSAPRLDTAGKSVDAHSGNIVGPINGTYFLYGEWYGRGPYTVINTTDLPRLSVYSSTDMVHWEFGGLLHNNTSPSWAETGLWAGASKNQGTWWCPWAVYSEARQKVILWFTATPGPCCDAYWGVAESSDGIHFELISLNETGANHLHASMQLLQQPEGGRRLQSMLGAGVVNPKDGNAVLIDDDGVGYIAYTAMAPFGKFANGTLKPAPGGSHPPGFKGDHMVAIERLTPDLHHSTKVQVGHLFPADFVEGVMIFKRKGTYYVIYSSCCCASRYGSGAVVHSAKSIAGPWVQQSKDVNCGAGAPMCGAPGFPKENRPLDITVHAQGLGLSVIGNEFIWQGERWLSAPGNNVSCGSLCEACGAGLTYGQGYIKGDDFSYWIPLKFDTAGTVQQFEPFVDSWSLGLPSVANKADRAALRAEMPPPMSCGLGYLEGGVYLPIPRATSSDGRGRFVANLTVAAAIEHCRTIRNCAGFTATPCKQLPNCLHPPKAADCNTSAVLNVQFKATCEDQGNSCGPLAQDMNEKFLTWTKPDFKPPA